MRTISEYRHKFLRKSIPNDWSSLYICIRYALDISKTIDNERLYSLVTDRIRERKLIHEIILDTGTKCIIIEEYSYETEQYNTLDIESELRAFASISKIKMNVLSVRKTDVNTFSYGDDGGLSDKKYYTGKILEVSLHHGQQQRTTSMRDSPLLNIGTEHIIQQSPTNEYTIPFETRYVSDSTRSSTLRSRSNNSIVVPVLNSPRTHFFPNSPIRQSRSNGNFYLSTAPTRSLNSINSSFRLDIRTD